MRKVAAAFIAAVMVIAGGAGCDDNNSTPKTGIDEDDTRLGPGDGNDETGPGR